MRSSTTGVEGASGTDGGDSAIGSIGVTIVNGQLPGTWQAKVVKPGGGAWLGSPDWSLEGRRFPGTHLKSGDSILSVDRTPVRKIEKPQAALRGAPFTRVSLLIQRQDLSCCVDVIRTPLLSGQDLETCHHYRTDLDEKLQRLVAGSVEFRQHMQEEPAERGLNQSWADVLIATPNLSPARDEGRENGTCADEDWRALESSWEGRGWQVAMSPCSSARTEESQRQASSPAGSADSLDDVIQQLDKAASLDDAILKLGASIAPPVIHRALCGPFKTASDFRESDYNFASPRHGSGSFHPHIEKERTDVLKAKELANADRPDRSLNVQRDLTWISPKRAPRRRSRSRSSSRSPSGGRKPHVRRSHDGRYQLDDSGPIHLQMPTNWSAWGYAGDEAYLFAIHFQSGIENTKASTELMSAARFADVEPVSTRHDVIVKRGPDGKLGVAIGVAELSDPVLISGVMPGSAAAKSGLVREGHVLHAIDGVR